jgi:hypothetical protein
MLTEIGVIRTTVTQKSKRFSKNILLDLKFDYLFMFSQMMSEGHGAISRDQLVTSRVL